MVAAGWLWNRSSTPSFPDLSGGFWHRLQWHIADVVHYVVPQYFESLFTYLIVVEPGWGIALVIAVGAAFIFRGSVRRRQQIRAEKLRDIALEKFARCGENLAQDDSCAERSEDVSNRS